MWKPITKLLGKFEISESGQIRNTSTGKILKLHRNKQTGYLGVAVKPDGRTGKTILIRLHRELANAFIPNLDNLPQVNHKDGNKINNKLDNLEWCTNQYNCQHAHDNNLVTTYRGHEHSQSKLSQEDREFILKNYTRNDPNFTGRALAAMFGVDKMQIYRVIKRGY